MLIVLIRVSCGFYSNAVYCTPGSRHADVSSSFQRARNNSPTSCSFAFSQDGCIDSHRHHHSPCFRSPPNKVQRQLNNCSNHRRQNLVDDFISLTASFPRKRTHSNAFQVPESPREIAVPRWCKMPYPLSWDNAQKPKGGNDSTPQGHFNTSSKTQSNFNYRVSLQVLLVFFHTCSFSISSNQQPQYPT